MKQLIHKCCGFRRERVQRVVLVPGNTLLHVPKSQNILATTKWCGWAAMKFNSMGRIREGVPDFRTVRVPPHTVWSTCFILQQHRIQTVLYAKEHIRNVEERPIHRYSSGISIRTHSEIAKT